MASIKLLNIVSLNQTYFNFNYLDINLYKTETEAKICVSAGEFKYYSLFVQQLSTFKLSSKWTTNKLTNLMLKQGNKYPRRLYAYIRLKYINNQLYWYDFGKKYFHYGYENWFIYYFYNLTQEYGQYIDDFDIVIHLASGSVPKSAGSSESTHFLYDYTKLPFFISEGYQYSDNKLLLHCISRSLISHFNYIGNYQTFLDHKSNEWDWKNKINKAVFRGSATNVIRDEIVYAANNNINTKYFDAKFFYSKSGGKQHAATINCGIAGNMISSCWMNETLSISDEMKYKYQIILDGTSIRDAFSRQIKYDTLILKQISKSKEFWYYDLKNDSNVIEFNDANELIDIISYIGNVVDNVENGTYNDQQKYEYNHFKQIVNNSANYVETHFNIESLHCFMMKMLNIYNEYFYDKSSIIIENEDVMVDNIEEFFNCKQYDNQTIVQNQHAICTVLHPYHDYKIVK